MHWPIGRLIMLSCFRRQSTRYGVVSSSIHFFPPSLPLKVCYLVTVNVPASTKLEYKYIRKNNGAVTWESDPNRSFNTPASGSFTINDTWR